MKTNGTKLWHLNNYKVRIEEDNTVYLNEIKHFNYLKIL